MTDGRYHATYGGSNCHRWMACPGSVRLSREAPQRPPSQYALDGTRAHAVLEARLKDRNAPVHDKAMSDAADMVLEYLDANDLIVLSSEEWRPFPQGVVPAAECGGASDVVAMGFASGWGSPLTIIDFKYGEGVQVAAEGNKQGLFYATTVLWEGAPEGATGARIVIIQPRAPVGDPIREWEVDALDIIEFQAEAEEAIARTLDPAAPLIPGPHCRFCPAETTCPAREQQALAVARDGFGQVVLPEANTLDIGRLAQIVEGAPMLRSWLKAVDAHAFELAAHGVQLPGLKLVAGKGRREWREGAVWTIATMAAQATEGALEAQDFIAPQALLGITEAEKLVREAVREAAPKGQKKQAVERANQRLAEIMTKEPSQSLSLVPISDPRPAVSPAARYFEGVTIINEESTDADA